MALSVEFAISDPLNKALETLKGALDQYRALVVVVEKETLTTGGELMKSSENLDADFAQIRASLAITDAALVVVSLDGRLTLVTFTPQDIKPRQRMIYAASSSRLRDYGKIVGDTHISAVDELSPKLFGHKEADRVALRSDAEVQRDNIAEMQAKDLKEAPQRAHAMHSMSTSVSGNAMSSVKEVVDGKHCAAVLSMKDGSIVLDSTVESAKGVDTASVPADEPRFIFVRSDNRSVLAYVVPEGCKPKVRMQYATTKASLVSELKSAGVSIDKSVECDSVSALPQRIENAFAAPTEASEDSAAEAPAKKPFMKGPRMFMPA